jgi:DNA polymerase-1
MRRDLALDTLEEVAELECKLLPVIVQMELTGLPVDRGRWEWIVNMQAAEAAALKKMVSVELGVDNVDNNDEILAALRQLGLQIERTNREALALYMDVPAVQHLTRYRPLNSFVIGAGEGVLRAIERSEDGRVHATLNQIGATTGRMSAEQPNLLGLPTDKAIRSCITASPGKKLVVGDYNAIELRVLADQTGDEQLTKVFCTGGDPHRHTASLVMKIPEEQVTEEQRRKAKAPNFGVSFGMGKDKLIAYARKNYGVKLPPDEAERFKQTFLENYSGVDAWQKKIGEEMPAVLRTKSGRTCYFLDADEEYNARLAFPIQGTAADGMKQAMVLLYPHLKRLGAKIILAVHDELLVEAPEEHADAVKELMREYMIAGMQKYVPSVPIVVEPEVRSTWSK